MNNKKAPILGALIRFASQEKIKYLEDAEKEFYKLSPDEQQEIIKAADEESAHLEELYTESKYII